jgi:hypothetical protein
VLDSTGLWTPQELQRQLTDAGLLVICAADAERCASAARSGRPLRVKHWSVPFLESVLRSEYPDGYAEVADQIQEQRRSGRWSRDETEFCSQVRTSLAAGRLETVLDAGGLAQAPGAEPAPENEHERPVRTAVLCAASFFPGLSPGEFGRVVEVLLRDEQATIREPDPTGAVDVFGERKEVETRKPLLHLWTEGADRILRECRLVPMKDPSRGTVVGFSDAGGREAGRDRFMREHGFYLKGKFASIRDAGLLFDPSEGIARAVVELAAAFPDFCDAGRLVDRLVASAKPAAGSWSASAAVPGEQGEASRTVSRVAELLRACGERADTRPIVDEVFAGLMDRGEFETVLCLVEPLVSAPGFKPFHWMRQLVDRGHGALVCRRGDHRASRTVKDATFNLLVQQLGGRANVFPVFHELSTWLPPEDRPGGWLDQRGTRPDQPGKPVDQPKAMDSRSGQPNQPGKRLIRLMRRVDPLRAHLYQAREQAPGERLDPAGACAESEKLALRLLPDYANGMLATVPLARFGEWPSLYPLLAAVDAEEPGRDWALVTRWLLHPGIRFVLAADLAEQGRRIEISEKDWGAEVARLVAAWAFILYGAGHRPPEPALAGSASSAPAFPARAIPGPGLSRAALDGAPLPCPAEDRSEARSGRDELFVTLIRELALASGGRGLQEVRAGMIGRWERMKSDLTHLVESGDDRIPRDERSVYRWKRNLLRVLLAQFRVVQRAGGAPSSTTPSLA